MVGSAVPVPASHLDVARDAEAATRAANAAMAAALPFADSRDFGDARRGLIALVPQGIVATDTGTVLWNLGEYAFVDGELAPATVNPSLWRMARLNMANGLFRVAERIYQLRGFDISNMTVLEGDSGLIVIDPLTTAEVARAALALYRAHRPGKPVVAVWGLGFSDGRKYTLKEGLELVAFLKSKEAGECTVMLGVPTYWRTLERDAVNDKTLLDRMRTQLQVAAIEDIPAAKFDAVIKKLRALTTNGKLQFKDAGDRDVSVPVSFKGFGEAYDTLTK